MSALGHLQTLEPTSGLSALPPKADIQTSGPKVPTADIHSGKKAAPTSRSAQAEEEGLF